MEVHGRADAGVHNNFKSRYSKEPKGGRIRTGKVGMKVGLVKSSRVWQLVWEIWLGNPSDCVRTEMLQKDLGCNMMESEWCEDRHQASWND